ncbi:MAG TPA: SPOR domain-containing protein [Lysobacter sp.]|nr:SPOR domain-containing protein [Lysobacter sp.]
MAVKRGKSQARRNSGNRGGMPGWAWLVLGVIITLAAVLFLPRYLKNGDGDGFFRPRANPDAQPMAESPDEDEGVVADGAQAAATDAAAKDKDGDFDFYTLLPGNEVALSDAQLAAAEKEEQARAQRAAQADDDGAALPQPLPETPTTTDKPAPTQVANATPAPAANTGNDTPYLLQAGAFGASGDAEAVKAKIALLGLNARVESASIGGKTVYRVRMGPYGTASELATAKDKLANGGLPALAIKVK